MRMGLAEVYDLTMSAEELKKLVTLVDVIDWTSLPSDYQVFVGELVNLLDDFGIDSETTLLNAGLTLNTTLEDA
jgi:hypothetical protein